MSRKRSASCDRKAKYTTETIARAALRVKLARPETTGQDFLIVYRCRFGPHWHVGHDNRLRQQTYDTPDGTDFRGPNHKDAG